MTTIMKRRTRTVEVKDPKLVSMYEKEGWETVSKSKDSEPKAVLKPTKKFSGFNNDVEDSEPAEVTPAVNEEASN